MSLKTFPCSVLPNTFQTNRRNSSSGPGGKRKKNISFRIITVVWLRDVVPCCKKLHRAEREFAIHLAAYGRLVRGCGRAGNRRKLEEWQGPRTGDRIAPRGQIALTAVRVYPSNGILHRVAGLPIFAAVKRNLLRPFLPIVRDRFRRVDMTVVLPPKYEIRRRAIEAVHARRPQTAQKVAGRWGNAVARACRTFIVHPPCFPQ